MTATVGSVGTAASTLNSLFSSETLAAYTSLYEEPEVVVEAIVDELQVDALLEGAKAEAVLLLAFAVWRLRSQLLSPWVARTVTRRRRARSTSPSSSWCWARCWRPARRPAPASR